VKKGVLDVIHREKSIQTNSTIEWYVNGYFFNVPTGMSYIRKIIVKEEQ
jgi:hypothetical protein